MALRLRGATSGYIELKAPASAGDNTLTLPTNNGSANQLLKTDGSGNLSWTDDNSGVSLSGSTDNTLVTVTGANALQGESVLTFDGNDLQVRPAKANFIVAKSGLTVIANSDLHTTYDFLQIGAGGAIASYSTETVTASTHFIHNAYRGTDAAWKRRYADTATRIAMNSPGGAIEFEHAVTGNADTDITWVQSLMVDSSGRLLLGTTTEGHASADDLTIATDGTTGITLRSDSSGLGNIFFSDGTSGSSEYEGRLTYDHGSNILRLENSNNGINIDSSGNVGIGTSTPGQKLGVAGNIRFEAGDPTLEFNNGGAMVYARVANTLQFASGGGPASPTEKMRIASDGDVLIQATSSDMNSADNTGFSYNYHATGPYIRVKHAGAGGGYANYTLIHFVGASSMIGEVKQDGDGTITYATSSDYRLKENIVDLTGAITRLKNLKPKRFNFKINSGLTKDGFLAHELQEVVPESVNGTKDEVVTADSKVNNPVLADLDVGDPVYQTADASRVVPLLTAALKEAIAKIETLETKVAALESA